MMNLIGAFSDQPEKQQAYKEAEVIWNRIHSRQLYKVTDLKEIESLSHRNEDDLTHTEFCQFCDCPVEITSANGNTADGNHIVRTAQLGVCGSDKNPMDEIWFYDSKQPNVLYHKQASKDSVLVLARNKEKWTYLVCRNPKHKQND